MVGPTHVVRPWMPRAARDSDAWLCHVSVAGGARRRGRAAGGVPELFNRPLVVVLVVAAPAALVVSVPVAVAVAGLELHVVEVVEADLGRLERVEVRVVLRRIVLDDVVADVLG